MRLCGNSNKVFVIQGSHNLLAQVPVQVMQRLKSDWRLRRLLVAITTLPAGAQLLRHTPLRSSGGFSMKQQSQHIRLTRLGVFPFPLTSSFVKPACVVIQSFFSSSHSFYKTQSCPSFARIGHGKNSKPQSRIFRQVDREGARVGSH